MTRHRNIAYDPSISALIKYKYTPVDQVEVFDTVNHTLSHKAKDMWDVVTKNYTARIRDGEVINNPCLFRVTSGESGGGSYDATLDADSRYKYKTVGGSITKYHAGATGLTPLDPEKMKPYSGEFTNLTKVAKFRALKNIDTTPFEFMEDLFEIRETVRFLKKGPFKGMLDLAKSYKKGHNAPKVTTRAGKVSQVGNTWLEYRFAFSPLVRSALAATEAMVYKEPARPQRRTARGFCDHDFSLDEDFSDDYSPSIYNEFHRNLRGTLRLRAGVLYTVNNPVEDLSWRLGLRAKDIPETMWAILPLSFMVDRIVDISGTISALNNLRDPNLSILAGWSVHKDEQKASLTLMSQTIPGWSMVIDGDAWNENSFIFERNLWSPSYLDAVPTFDLSGLYQDVSSIADMTALIKQLVS